MITAIILLAVAVVVAFTLQGWKLFVADVVWVVTALAIYAPWFLSDVLGVVTNN